MITIYTRTQCAYCAMVKRFLDIKGKDYKTINLDEDLEAESFIKNKTGRSTVPVTMIDDEYVIGWNPAQLGALL